MRAKKSLAPPGAYGTTMRIGRAGYSAAHAALCSVAARIATVFNHILITPPSFVRSPFDRLRANGHSSPPCVLRLSKRLPFVLSSSKRPPFVLRLSKRLPFVLSLSKHLPF